MRKGGRTQWSILRIGGKPRRGSSVQGRVTSVQEGFIGSWVKPEVATVEKECPDKQWHELFSDPSHWWDHRPRKRTSSFPDFINKKTGNALWLDGRTTPPWVASKVTASLGPGTIQLDVISSVERLSRYNKAGQFMKTLTLFQQMQLEGISADYYIFLDVLKACSALGILSEGRNVHRQIVETACEQNPHIGSALIDMYTKCGSLQDARTVFDKMHTRTVVSWTAMILGCVKCKQELEALELFRQMQHVRVEPNSVTFVALLNACASLAAVEEGRRIHRHIVRRGCESNAYVSSALVDMYAKCGSLKDAWTVFDIMPTRSVVTWTAMILGCVKCGHEVQALRLFKQMQQSGVQPNSVTFVVLLNACASLAGLDEGRYVHRHIVQHGCDSDAYVGSSLVDMYAKCGSLEDARTVFERMHTRDVVSWNALILGCVKCAQEPEALALFRRMQLEGVEPNSGTFVALLNACAGMGALEDGRRIHKQIVQEACDSNAYVSSSLVAMYAKCGSLEDARSVFDKMPNREVESWNALILGCVKCGQELESLELFREMQLERITPDSVTFLALLNACASMAALEEGRRIHRHIVQLGCESNAFVSNALVDMYAKCGSLDDARTVFEKMPTHDVVSWNAMMMGLAMHGLGKEAMTLFEAMSSSGSEINEVTFLCLLSACSHAGMVNEGLKYFEAMFSVFGLTPTQEHYSTMVDLLGRAGQLEDAEAIVLSMPLEPSAAIWMSILASCRIHGNLEMGERAFKQVVELDPNNAAGYVLLSSIHETAGNGESKHWLRKERLGKRVRKEPGRTWIEVNNKIHSFVVNDMQHPESLEIRKELSRLMVHMKKAGYVPDSKCASQDSDEEKKLSHVYHSEKIAIAFGLINTLPGTPLRIVKNLRVCVDCHTATKYIAKITQRSIIVRDANRFHHFKDGMCSCEDYW